MKISFVMFASCSAIALLAASESVFSEPSGSPTTLAYVRAYQQAVPVSYIYTTSPNVCGVNLFEISNNDKGILATALTAIALGKKVTIEADGCGTGGYARMRSLYIHQ